MAQPQVVVRDEDGVEAGGALRRILDGDSDCGSVLLPLQDHAMEGEKRPRQLEEQQARGGGIRKKQEEQVGSQKPEITQSIQDQVPGGEEGVTRSARGTSGTSEAGDTTDWPPGGGEKPGVAAASAVVACEVVSVRAKIEMFERTARSAAGEERRIRSSSVGSPAACPRQPLGRSLSAKASAREWAFSASADRSQQPSVFESGPLARALSFQSFSRLATGDATPGFMGKTRADPPIANKGVVRSNGS